jgi:N utilization substance protein B
MSNPRHQARCLALEILYECDVADHNPYTVLNRRISDDLQNHDGFDWEADSIEFARQILVGVAAYEAQMDAIIIRFAPEWPLDQIAFVDRNILRIAFFEILSDIKTPLKVAINEAVELSKAYGSDSTPRFVNGVLGSVAEHQNELKFAVEEE